MANQIIPSNRPPSPAPGSSHPARPLPARRTAGPSERVRPLPAMPSGPEPAWLPGDVEVQVSGETFHAEAIREAMQPALAAFTAANLDSRGVADPPGLTL